MSGRDEQLNIYSLFKTVTWIIAGKKKKLTADPFLFSFEEGLQTFELQFQGHYGEPNLTLEFNPSDSEYSLLKISYNPGSGEWESIEP